METPAGDNTRPTSDRVREALFSSLESWAGTVQGLAVLDLYAGSGALGLEAWSRGATRVTAVEHDRGTAAVIRDNIKTLGAQTVEVVVGSVPQVLARGTTRRYDVVFADPPYPLDDDAIAADLALLIDQGWLAEDALVILERGKRSKEPRWPEGLEPTRSKKYGETKIWYARTTDTAASDAEPPGSDAIGAGAPPEQTPMDPMEETHEPR